MKTEIIINELNLFWQYPVVTEKTFNEQNHHNPCFLGFPWATLIDKHCELEPVRVSLRYAFPENYYYTCCQHISFRQLIPLFKFLRIRALYTPHKCRGEDKIQGIHLISCPLYAVNYEDKHRNREFTKGAIPPERDLLFSFMGAYQPQYLSDIRRRIFKMKCEEPHVIKNTDQWHFNEIVYTSHQNIEGSLNESECRRENANEYNTLLLRSQFSLCPSGAGPNTIRLWESLAAGTIPVILADTLELPPHPLWDETVIRIEECDLERVPEILCEIRNTNARRNNCFKLYKFFRSNYRAAHQEIIHYCDGSYYTSAIDGVARYDYHISLAFPARVFFRGPFQRNQMLNFAAGCSSPPIIITDNQLAGEIPNEFDVILVHHGIARTRAERDLQWHLSIRDFCVKGQNMMLCNRSSENTHIISVSSFCTSEFTRHYHKKYQVFQNSLILHSSELDESIVKTKWNINPIILGNWPTDNKGYRCVQKLKTTEFIFRQLVVINQNNIDDFNLRKQNIYLQCDIFLQLSLCEGNSYATLDALLCGLPVVATNVGLFYKDIPLDCFVSVNWRRINDTDYVLGRLRYAWEHRERIGMAGRRWFLDNCRMTEWIRKMRQIVLF